MANKPVTFQDARIIFRNFAGKEGQYNQEGDRNFCLVLSESEAQDMSTDGWNVKKLKDRDDIPGDPYLPVSVSFKNRPPRTVIITSRGRTDLTEAEVDILDWADIEKVDLIVTPYHWNVSGRMGVKAYLKSIFVTIREDELELKYAEVPYADELDRGDQLKELGAGPDDGIIDVDAWEDDDMKAIES